MRRRAATKSHWSPESLGAVARWAADPRYVTLSSATVTNWRNFVDGRSGVLIEANAPDWASSWGPACRPAVRFVRANLDRLDESSSGQPDGSRATVIDAVAGTNAPFSILMTLQPTSTSTQVFLSWYSLISANPRVVLEQTSGSLLRITRRDGSGTFANLTGTIQLGTSLRRVCATFDGTSFVLFVDTQLDNSTATAGGQGELILGKFRVGDDDGGGTGADMYLQDLTILPRAIGYNEWLRYYEWSVKQWGAIRPPTFVGAGTGDSNTGDVAPSYPTNEAGDLFLMHIAIRNAVTNPTTPLGWFLVYGPDDGAVNGRSFIYARDSRSSGGESGTVTVTIGAGNNLNMSRIYAVRGVTTAVSFGGYVEGGATSVVDNGLLNGPTIGTNGRGRLALAFAFNDSNSGTHGNITGETGGDWAQSAVYDTALGSNGTISLQTAIMRNGGVISGGTGPFGGTGDDGVCRGFALVGE